MFSILSFFVAPCHAEASGSLYIVGDDKAVFFEQSKTALPVAIEPFSEDFINEKQVQWVAFHKKLNQDHVPLELREIVSHLDDFLTPVIATLTSGQHNFNNWIAPGPWQ